VISKVVVICIHAEVWMQKVVASMVRILLAIFSNIMRPFMALCSYLMSKRVWVLILHPFANARRTIGCSECLSWLL